MKCFNQNTNQSLECVYKRTIGIHMVVAKRIELRCYRSTTGTKRVKLSKATLAKMSLDIMCTDDVTRVRVIAPKDVI